MKYVRVSFFDEFKCTAEKCTDNCCIGWEIDIDKDTLDYYNSIKGEFGKFLKDNITVSGDGSNCFCLKENERCAFLDENNLCRIYDKLGEDALCDICREHPRFYNFFNTTEESGIGLCCEEAARLLLECEKFVLLVDEIDEEPENTDEYSLFTEKMLFDCEYDIFRYINENSTTYKNGIDYALKSVKELCEKIGSECLYTDISDENIIFLMEKTEPVDGKWLPLVKKIKDNLPKIKWKEKEFITADKSFNHDYKLLLCYLIFRHFSSALSDGKIAERITFCITNLRFIELCDILTYVEKGEFLKTDRINNVKYWSRQIEYSEENTDMFITEYF